MGQALGPGPGDLGFHLVTLLTKSFPSAGLWVICKMKLRVLTLLTCGSFETPVENGSEGIIQRQDTYGDSPSLLEGKYDWDRVLSSEPGLGARFHVAWPRLAAASPSCLLPRACGATQAGSTTKALVLGWTCVCVCGPQSWGAITPPPLAPPSFLFSLYTLSTSRLLGKEKPDKSWFLASRFHPVGKEGRQRGAPLQPVGCSVECRRLGAVS